MSLDGTEVVSEMALAGLVAIPVLVVAAVLILALVLFVAVGVVVAAGWALTRASAKVLGEGNEIWR
jgi:hypothetical protein